MSVDVQVNAPKKKGFTLIEVMIALAIFAIGFLAVAGMQIHALNSTTHSREVTEAQALAQREVERLRAIPLYDPDLDLDGNGANEKFDFSPDFSAGTHTDNTAWTGPYTVNWTVVDNAPLASIPNVYSTPPPNNVVISKTITVTVTPDNSNDILDRMELIKVWHKDG